MARGDSPRVANVADVRKALVGIWAKGGGIGRSENAHIYNRI